MLTNHDLLEIKKVIVEVFNAKKIATKRDIDKLITRDDLIKRSNLVMAKIAEIRSITRKYDFN